MKDFYLAIFISFIAWIAVIYAGFCVGREYHTCPTPPIPTVSYVQEYMDKEPTGVPTRLFIADWAAFSQDVEQKRNEARIEKETK